MSRRAALATLVSIDVVVAAIVVIAAYVAGWKLVHGSAGPGSLAPNEITFTWLSAPDGKQEFGVRVSANSWRALKDGDPVRVAATRDDFTTRLDKLVDFLMRGDSRACADSWLATDLVDLRDGSGWVAGHCASDEELLKARRRKASL